VSDLDRPRQTTSGPVVHACSIAGCGKWGGFGFAMPTAETLWWCWEHYPYKKTPIAIR
jgi:hypothetical protein